MLPVPHPVDLVKEMETDANKSEAEEEENKKGTTRSKINTESLAQHAYNPRWLVLEGPEDGPAYAKKKEMVGNWRAMLHIDLLRPYQGKGWGRRMIEMFCEAVRNTSSHGADYGKGVYLGVAGENDKVVKFYEKVGFRVFEGGEVEGGVWMVRDL